MRAAKHYIAPGMKALPKAHVARVVKKVRAKCSVCNVLILVMLAASVFMVSHWAAVVSTLANLIWMCRD